MLFLIDLVDKAFGISLCHDRQLVEDYLASAVGQEKLNVLKKFLRRLKLNYENMFYLTRDTKICNRLGLYLDYNTFSLKEKALIEETMEALNRAPSDVKGQLISCCCCVYPK